MPGSSPPPSSASPSVEGKQFPIIQTLSEQIQKATQSQLSGSLNFDTVHVPRMHLFFVVGRLIWASGGCNRFRRWRRLLNQYCPEAFSLIPTLSLKTNTPYWEYEILGRLMEVGCLSREGARSLIRDNIVEVLFDIVQSSKLIERFSRTESNFLSPQDIITLIPLEELFTPLETQWQAWCDARLAQYSPNLAPVLEQPLLLKAQVSKPTYERLSQLLQGQYSLRELAALTQQNLVVLSNSLIAYEQQGLLQLRVIADLAGHNPTMQREATTPAPAKVSTSQILQSKANRSPLTRSKVSASNTSSSKQVLCVDDSLMICEQMEKIINGAGYRYIGIQDSVQALQVIIEEKPDLVFVDLIMPVIGGYELCGQIRRVSDLKDIPLIILTSSDTMLDRVRGKLVGANGYLTKPVPAEEVLATLTRWVPLEKASH